MNKTSVIFLTSALVILAGGAYWITSQTKPASSEGTAPTMFMHDHQATEEVLPYDGVSTEETAPASKEASESSTGPRVIKEAVLTLEVEGMTCAACSAAVKNQLEKVNGVLSAEADYRAGKATVKYDAAQVKDLKAFTAECAAAINRAGYKVKG